MAHDELLDALPGRGPRASSAPRSFASRARRFRSRRAAGAAGRRKRPCAGCYLAGDWIDTGLPATIESAVRSGHRAAELCIG